MQLGKVLTDADHGDAKDARQRADASSWRPSRVPSYFLTIWSFFSLRLQPPGQRARPRHDPRSILRMRFEPELGRLLQPGDGQADRAAIDRGRPGTAQAAAVGDRT